MNQQDNENEDNDKSGSSLGSSFAKGDMSGLDDVSRIAQQRPSLGDEDSKEDEKVHFDEHLAMEYEMGMMNENDFIKNEAVSQGVYDYYGDLQKEDIQLQKYSKVSEFLLQAENTFLTGVRNVLTYQQNRNFLYNERRCLEILHSNNSIFTFESYRCTMAMCCILLDAGINLMKEEKLYLAEKYLLRSKQITEPSEKHLLKKRDQLQQQNQISEIQFQDQKEQNEEDEQQEERIFEKDFRYHEIRIEIALNLCNVYKKQRKKLVKNQRILAKKSSAKVPTITTSSNLNTQPNNPMNAIQEEQEENEGGLGGQQKKIKIELEDDDDDDSDENHHQLEEQRGNKQKQSIKNEEKEREMNQDEQIEELECKDDDKIAKALLIVNQIQETLTEDYLAEAKYDLKGTLCKFFSKKVQIINELLKKIDLIQDEQQKISEEEEMSIEMLRCAEFVISTLEGLLMPQKPGEQTKEQQDAVILASILSYTWTKLGKYYSKRNDLEKAEQCYRNAYEKIENFFREGQDRLFLKDKFKRKYEKFVGKLAFDQIGDNSVVEFTQFQDEIKKQKQKQSATQNPMKNYLVHSGIHSEKIQTPAGQFYIDPEYLNQIQSHHTTKSLNKNRHLKKSIPVRRSKGTFSAHQNSNTIEPSTLNQSKFKKSLQQKLDFYRQQVVGGSSTTNNAQSQEPDIASFDNNSTNIKFGTTSTTIIIQPQSKPIRPHPQSAKTRGSPNRNIEGYRYSNLKLIASNSGFTSPSSSSNFPNEQKQFGKLFSSAQTSYHFRNALIQNKGVSSFSKIDSSNNINIHDPISYRNPDKESYQESDRLNSQGEYFAGNDLNKNSVKFLNDESQKQNYSQFGTPIQPNLKADNKQALKQGIQRQSSKLNLEDAITENIMKYVQSQSKLTNNNSTYGSRSTLASSHRQLIPYKRPQSSNSSTNLRFGTVNNIFPKTLTNRSNQSFIPPNNPQNTMREQNSLAQTLGNFDQSSFKSPIPKPLNNPYFALMSRQIAKPSNQAALLLNEMENMKQEINELLDPLEQAQNEGKNIMSNIPIDNTQLNMMISRRPLPPSQVEKVTNKKKGGLVDPQIQKKPGFGKAQIRISLPESNKRHEQNQDERKASAQPSSSSKAGSVSDPRKEGSQRRMISTEKTNGRNKDSSSSIQQLQAANSPSSPLKEDYPLPQNLQPTQTLASGLLAQTTKSIAIYQNPSPQTKEKDGDLQISKTPTQNASFLKKSGDTHPDSYQIPQQSQLQHQPTNYEKMNKSTKLPDLTKSILPNSSKFDEKNYIKSIPALKKQVSTNLTEDIFKRQSTNNYEQFQLDIPPTQSQKEEDKKRSGNFAAPFIKQKFEQFASMNIDGNKIPIKINETQTSQDEQDDEQAKQSHNHSQEAHSYNGEDTLKGFDEFKIGSNGNEAAQNTQNEDIKMKRGTNQIQSINLNNNNMLKSIKTQSDSRLTPNQIQSPLVLQDQSKLLQFHLSADNNTGSYSHSQSPKINSANSHQQQDKLLGPSSVTNNLTSSSSRGRLNSMNILNNMTPIAQNIKIKTISFPSIKQSKYLFVQNRIQELLFVPMYFYKSIHQFSPCQWNINNIIINLESVEEDENAEDVETLLKNTFQKNSQNKGGLPITSDKIRYNIKMAIFIESSITDEFKVNNPLIFTLQNQSLNFIEHLWPSDKNKIETKYELALLLLDRWIKEQDFNVVEEFYNIELTYQNVQLQFILRGYSSQNYQCSIDSQTIKSIDKFDQLQLFGMKLNFIINKIARIVKCPYGDIIEIPNLSIDNAKLSLRTNNLQCLKIHQNSRRRLRNFISYYNQHEFDFDYLIKIKNFESGNATEQDSPLNVLQPILPVQEIDQVIQEDNKKKSGGDSPQVFMKEVTLSLKDQNTSFSNFSPYLIPNSVSPFHRQQALLNQIQITVKSQPSQKYQNLKLKMRERILQVKKDSDPIVPLEKQVPISKNELQVVNKIGFEALSPSFFNSESPSPASRISPTQRHQATNQLSQGFTGAVERQYLMQSLLQQQSPKNQQPVISWVGEDAYQLKQQEQNRITEEYKKKYEIAAASAGVTPISQTPKQNSLVQKKESGFKVEKVKKQIESINNEYQNQDSILSNLNGTSIINPLSSSPIHNLGSMSGTFSKMASMLSMKSQKSLFSRFAPQTKEENQQAEENQESKKQSGFSQNYQKSGTWTAENSSNEQIVSIHPPPLSSNNNLNFTTYFPPFQFKNQSLPQKYLISFNNILRQQSINNEEKEIEDLQVADELCEDSFICLPSFYQYKTFSLNPFENNSLLFKTIIKSNQLFFFVQIFYLYDQEVEQTINYNKALSHSNFILKADSMVQKGGWKCEISLKFNQFVEKLIRQRTKFSFFKFLCLKGFSQKQKFAIKQGLEQDLQVKNCQLVFEWDSNPLIQESDYKDKYSISENEQEEEKNSMKSNESSDSPYLGPFPHANINNSNSNKNNQSFQDEKRVSLVPQSENERDQQIVTFKFIKLQKATSEKKKQGELDSPKQCSHSYKMQEGIYQNEGQQFNSELTQIFERNIIKQEKLNTYKEQQQQSQYKVPIAQVEMFVQEVKSNLDIKLLSLQDLTKLQTYETPARKEDFTSSFYLIQSKYLTVMIKYVTTEHNSYHKLTVYKPFSHEPLLIYIINEAIILERLLNFKWLDATVITLTKNITPTSRKIKQPHIYQGLTSIDNLKIVLLNNLLQKKLHMNGCKVKLRQIFSSENERVKYLTFSKRIERLKKVNNLILSGISKTDEVSIKQLANKKMETRDFLQQAKYAVATFDVTNEQQFQQNEILFNNFDRKTLRAYSYLPERQKVFMMLTVFRSKICLGFDQVVFVRVDVFPWNSQRNKLIKLIFDRSDIGHLFDRSFTFNTCFNELLLFKIIERIGKSLVYSKAHIYKKFSIPLAKINPQQVDRHQFCLINRYSIKPPGNLTPKEISKKSFLDLIQRGERVLFQGVKRVLNVYAIVTVGYYCQLDSFYLQIYFPFTCRRYTNTFYSSNLQNLSGNYLNTLLKESIALNYQEELLKLKDYNAFQKKYLRLDPSKAQTARYSQKNSATQKKQDYSQLHHLSEESFDDEGDPMISSTQMYSNPKPFLKLLTSNNSATSSPSFFELAIWEEIVRTVDILIDQNGDMMMNMDNYSGVMREYLLKTIVNFSGNKNGLFEVLVRFKDDKQKQDYMNSPEVSLMEGDDLRLDLYVRINFFEKVNSVNEKVMLRQIFFSYYQNNRDRFKFIPKEVHNSNQFLRQEINNQQQQSLSPSVIQTPRTQPPYNHQQLLQSISNADLNNLQTSHLNFNTNEENQNSEYFLDFSDSTFYYSDLIGVANLLLDRIRQSIQDKYSPVIHFHSKEKENKIPEQANPLKDKIERLSQLPIKAEVSSQFGNNFSLERQGEILLTQESKIEEFNLEQIDKKARKKIKMNNNINMNELLDTENKKQYMKTLYRGVFTVRPLQILAIFYYNKFYIQIFNTVNGKNMISDLSFTTVEHQIPYLRQMLQLELYQEIGKRIYLSFKNRLMIKSYPQLIDL